MKQKILISDDKLATFYKYYLLPISIVFIFILSKIPSFNSILDQEFLGIKFIYMISVYAILSNAYTSYYARKSKSVHLTEKGFLVEEQIIPYDSVTEVDFDGMIIKRHIVKYKYLGEYKKFHYLIKLSDDGEAEAKLRARIKFD